MEMRKAKDAAAIAKADAEMHANEALILSGTAQAEIDRAEEARLVHMASTMEVKLDRVEAEKQAKAWFETERSVFPVYTHPNCLHTGLPTTSNVQCCACSSTLPVSIIGG